VVEIFCHERLDGRSISQARFGSGVCLYGKVIRNTKKEMIFYVETLNWENPRGGGEFTIICKLQELQELFASLSAKLN